MNNPMLLAAVDAQKRELDALLERLQTIYATGESTPAEMDGLIRRVRAAYTNQENLETAYRLLKIGQN